MGLFDTLARIASSAASATERYAERQANDYSSGYERGYRQASSMSDSELRSELKRAKENGISGMSGAGKTKAMIDEYKSRQNK